MANVNTVILAGNLTRDPELRYTPSGTPVARLGLAVNNRVKKGDEWVDDPCFVDITVFGRMAESIAERAAKGVPVLAKGRLQYRTWEGQDGQRHSKHEVVADTVQVLVRTQAAKTREPGEDDIADDEVPF